MKRQMHWFWLPVFLIVGCGPSVPSEVADGGAVRIAGDPAPGGGPGSYDAPPQRFRARPHVSRDRRYRSVTADLGSMPALTLRMGQCYGYGDNDDNTAAIATSPSTLPGGMPPSSPSASSQRPKKEKVRKHSADSKKPARAQAKMSAGAIEGSAEAPMAEMSAPQAAPTYESSDAEPARSAPLDDSLMIAGEPAGEEEEEFSAYEDWGAEIYLSNDDSMSLSSAQRVLYAIDNFLPLPKEHIRPHELLNYFSFETATVEPGRDFSVLADVGPDPRQEGIYSLGLSVAGRPVTRQSRRNVALTWVIDRSGSMSSEGRMEYLKRGLQKSVAELKTGDMVHMVLFDHSVCVPVENFVVGRDNIADLEKAIDALSPMGATDIHSGLTRAYQIADSSYQPHHSNRVVLITDALTNTGVTDEGMISMISRYFDSRRIRLSGVGVGRDFNDALLDRLTERGKGAYVFLGSEAEVDAVFGPRFISLIETTALDVHFKLHLPQSLRMNVFYGEESSTVKEDVQAIHYFANTAQLFLSDLMARGGTVRPEDDVMLTVEYSDPESGDALFEDYVFNLGEIQSNGAYNIQKGRLIMAWIDLLAGMADRPNPGVYRYSEGSWEDPDGYYGCEDGRAELQRLAGGIEQDAETRRVLQLWDKYCSRYERPRNPVKRQVVKPGNSWPGARPDASR